MQNWVVKYGNIAFKDQSIFDIICLNIWLSGLKIAPVVSDELLYVELNMIRLMNRLLAF